MVMDDIVMVIIYLRHKVERREHFIPYLENKKKLFFELPINLQNVFEKNLEKPLSCLNFVAGYFFFINTVTKY